MLSIVINVIMFSNVMLKSVMLTIITLSATMVYYCAECSVVMLTVENLWFINAANN